MTNTPQVTMLTAAEADELDVLIDAYGRAVAVRERSTGAEYEKASEVHDNALRALVRWQIKHAPVDWNFPTVPSDVPRTVRLAEEG